MTNHIVLFEPLMPANTGNIARTTAGTDAILHLIEPLGFDLDDKHVKRAGLDYWEHVKLVKHASLPDFLATLTDKDQLYLVSKFANMDYTQPNYMQMQGDQYFLFGKETTGLPEVFMRQNPEKAIRIPQNDTHIRSLNLSNTVAIVLFEALRQQHFPNLDTIHNYEQDKLK
ncbi:MULTISPECIES: tRNA (cytidine(34)-2'-O)-methyltransferase [Leuconostoc gelidum group]|jgi:tRNA (cytidine/uridine-2'-O-)-methyltransferase|uniref:Putative tRNA (cytidine(34)-2'-O)-methyltransferase n=2 Tax=Leuconostoc gelidum group TaxID=3016637 RepID=A0A9Q3XW02_9LACO|nr:MULTISPECIES: tRNA (cytidine(34)-2'-O)-methyltransferase [Leuconostoc gelidum group]MBR2277195.1 tRNA (cytidine(34)-2'-O)-methyltransferase [Leuconostoc sp.]AFS40621.1 rRNA methylase [Leuconostoc gelidum JB7]MBZ5943733.1 tRNA (cytidine(34)-2'-O)-methyltransferase [Leuconostoc gasicomitatum]MBZ5946753.1 tRNA (cytidine(34)-2'-O)-methyltransferase [Leuconostoc gasicomitatum]MBZ5948279.1 tRNA (cytidine(34)-2'-O)-methyltransferase [Leuconostoc gasicomitatum]